MALKDILNNASYGDDMVISIAGQSITLGEVRSADAAERNALARRAQTLEAAETGLASRAQKLQQAGLLDANMEPITTREVKNAVVAATGMDESDPLFGPLVKQTKAELAAMQQTVTKELEGLKNQVSQIAGVTRQALTGYLDDTYKSVYSQELAKLPEDARKDISLESAIKFATDRRLMDERGRLDIANAVDRLTWDRRKELERAELAKGSQKLKEDQQALSQMNRPGLHGHKVGKPTADGFNPMDDKGNAKSFEQAISEAASDDQIWESAAKFVN